MAASTFPTTTAKPIDWPRIGIRETSEAVRKVAISRHIPPESVKDAIEDNEEGEDSLDGPEGAAVDQPLGISQKKKLRVIICSRPLRFTDRSRSLQPDRRNYLITVWKDDGQYW